MASKTTLYVGGLEDHVTQQSLHDLFAPFGEVLSVLLPLDTRTDKSKGFGFVEFEEVEDAKHAIDNLHKAEFFGRVLTVNYAKPDAMNKNKAVWENAEEYVDKAVPKMLEDAMEVEEENE